MNVAVIGAGHGGCAAACACALRGHQVTLCKLGTKLHEAHFGWVLSHGYVELQGIAGSATVHLHRVTKDAGVALSDAEVVLVFYVANFHDRVAQQLEPHLRDGQLVVVAPGYAGSLLFARRLEERGSGRDVLFAELETLPYSSRIAAPGVVHISSKNVRHPVAGLPAARTAEVISRLEPLLGTCVERSSILESALHNPNLVIHTIGTVMSATQIERDGRSFHMYRDGFSDAIWRMVGQLDAEKMAVMERIGGRPSSYFDAFVLRTCEDLSTDPMVGFSQYAGEAPAGPDTIWTRYLTEDVPMGLGLLSSLGRARGVKTPMANGLLHIASVMHGRDYFSEARTVDVLWPSGDVDRLIQYVQHGGSRIVEAQDG